MLRPYPRTSKFIYLFEIMFCCTQEYFIHKTVANMMVKRNRVVPRGNSRRMHSMYLFLCLVSRIFCSYNGCQHHGYRKPERTRWEPTTTCELLRDWTGSQNELDLESQQQHWWEAPGSLWCASGLNSLANRASYCIAQKGHKLNLCMFWLKEHSTANTGTMSNKFILRNK